MQYEFLVFPKCFASTAGISSRPGELFAAMPVMAQSTSRRDTTHFIQSREDGPHLLLSWASLTPQSALAVASHIVVGHMQ